MPPRPQVCVPLAELLHSWRPKHASLRCANVSRTAPFGREGTMATDAGEIKLDPVNPRTANGKKFLDTVSRMAQADLSNLHKYAGMLAHKATLDSIHGVGSGAVVVLGEAISLPDHTASFACIL